MSPYVRADEPDDRAAYWCGCLIVTAVIAAVLVIATLAIVWGVRSMERTAQAGPGCGNVHMVCTADRHCQQGVCGR